MKMPLMLILFISSQAISQDAVLVHGWLGDGNIWNGTTLKQVVTSLPFHFNRVLQPSLDGYIASAYQANNLSSYLITNNVNAGVGIAYSMGGINGRHYLRDRYLLGQGQRLAQLYTIGTPHNGTRVANNIVWGGRILLLGVAATVYPVGAIFRAQGWPMVEVDPGFESWGQFASLLFAPAPLAGIIDVIGGPALHDLAEGSNAVTHINSNTDYEQNTVKVGIAGTEINPVLYRMSAAAFGYPEEAVLQLEQDISIMKQVFLLSAAITYFEQPSLESLSLVAANLGTYVYFKNIDYAWRKYVLESQESDGVVPRASQVYPNGSFQYYATHVGHLEQKYDALVGNALRAGLVRYGHGNLGAPTNLGATTHVGQIALTWNATAGAESYNVYRNEVLLTNTLSTGLTDNVPPGDPHIYVVRAVQGIYEGPASSPVTAQSSPMEAPTAFSASPYPGNIKLDWSPVPGATGYRISRDENLLATITSATSYWDGNATLGQTNTYTVRGTVGNYYGPPSPQVSTQATHLLSSSPSPLASNNQRKMAAIKGNGGYDPDKYFIAYESNGEVFVTMSTDQGVTWGNEMRGSAGEGTGSAPSIATWIDPTQTNQDVYCAYKEDQDIYLIPLRKRNYPHFSWGIARQISPGVTVSTSARPVVARTFLGEGQQLVTAWESNSGIVIRDLFEDSEGIWQVDVANTRIVEGVYRPSLSPGVIDGENPPQVFVSYDDGKDIFVASSQFPQPGSGFQVPASIVPQSYASQISGELYEAGHPLFHIVWEAVHDEEQATDGGVSWGEGDMPAQRRKVIYQQLDNEWSFTAAHEFVNGTSGSFYRPTVTHLSNGDVVMTWDDGTNTYKALYNMYNEGTWSITELYCNMVSPHVMTHGTDGLLESTKISGRSASGAPYQVKLGSICPPVVSEEEGAEIVASESEPPVGDSPRSDSTSFFSVRLANVKLKLMNGTVVRLGLVPTPDTLRLHEGNAWQRLTTLPVTLPSGIDSIVMEGSVALRSRGRFLGDDRGLRVSFDLIDVQTGLTIRRIGTERGFGRDTTHTLRIRDRLNSLAGRRVIIRPNINWAGRGTSHTKYTLVNIHTLYIDSATTSLNRLANAPEPESILPAVFALHQNYPNPFNPSTQLKFDLPEDGIVTLVVYDVLGRQVAELLRGHRVAGYHVATWDATDIASGIYFAQFVFIDVNGAPKYSKVNKLLLMK